MKTLRWKNRYLTGQPQADQERRAFVECLNGFVQAAKQKEHCQELDGFMEDMLTHLEQELSKNPADADLVTNIRKQLLTAFPLQTRSSTACRQCGVCDLAEKRVSEHIRSSAQCLGVHEFFN
ncbi:conserved hypothetical protein [Gammaproteobacteria bacterium]